MSDVLELESAPAGGFKLDIPSEEENQAALDAFFADQRAIKKERLAAVEAALPALPRIFEAMSHKTGQSYYLRSMLFSIWNGKPADMSNLMNLDWSLRKDILAVFLAFGFESESVEFFYDELSAELKKAGLFNWFREEGSAK